MLASLLEVLGVSPSAPWLCTFVASLLLLGAWATWRSWAPPWGVGTLILAVVLLFMGRASLSAPPGVAAGVLRGEGQVLGHVPSLRGQRFLLEVRGRRLLAWCQEAPPVGSRVQVLGFSRPPRAGFELERCARAGWSGALRVERWRLLSRGRGLAALRASLRRSLRRALEAGAPRHHDLLASVVLGEPLAPQRRRPFVAAGAAHLLSLSGLHVGLIAALALLALRALDCSPEIQRSGAAGVLLAFLLLVDARPPILRAVCTGCVFLLGPGRGDGFNRLSLACLLVLAWDPGSLRDLGFQLSFGTVAGLIAVGRLARQRSRWLRAIAGSALAFAVSAPLLLARLGQLPWAALVIGPPAIALFTVLLACAVAGALLGALASPLGWLPLQAADWLTEVLVAGVSAAGEWLPVQRVRPPAPAGALLAAGAFVLGALRRERGASHRLLFLIGVVLVIGWTRPLPASRELRVEARRGTLLVAGALDATWAGRRPSDRWLSEGLSLAGVPRLERDAWRRLELPGATLLRRGPRRVLWVRDARSLELAGCQLPPLELLVLGRRVGWRAGRRLWSRFRPVHLRRLDLAPAQ
ncbi:MAG TPA: hypothetical protein DEA08_19085 [Planctomycetes bacterium]|nr:hypothetical protein [Planctomycetota bacterium]